MIRRAEIEESQLIHQLEMRILIRIIHSTTKTNKNIVMLKLRETIEGTHRRRRKGGTVLQERSRACSSTPINCAKHASAVSSGDALSKIIRTVLIAKVRVCVHTIALQLIECDRRREREEEGAGGRGGRGEEEWCKTSKQTNHHSRDLTNRCAILHHSKTKSTSQNNIMFRQLQNE